MTKVNIAKFKSHLSYFLNKVRNGTQVIVMDRKTPIAKVSPYIPSSDERLVIQPAKASPKIFKKIKIPPAPPGTNSLKLLLEDRADDLESL